MKTSSSSVKLTAATNNSKNKRNPKDREKRKSQGSSDSSNHHNSDKGSPNKDNSSRKYAGYGPDQLGIMVEQSLGEHLSDEVSMAFIEDINYKLRHVVYDAVLKARLCGRNAISSIDIDNTFECLQIEKVYGAPMNPHWITFSDQNLHYLDDSRINLIEIAEECTSYIQALEPVLSRKWLPETKEVGKNLKNYFVLMCQAVVENDKEMRLTALKDISENKFVGPIIEWFYHFGYFLLSKDITYDCLTLRAFDLIEALEMNPISSMIISEKQIILLAKLLLQRLLRSVTTLEILRPICQMLALLCVRLPIRKMVMKKLTCKLAEMKEDFSLPIMCTVNELGLEAVCTIFLPQMKYLLYLVETHHETDLTMEILKTYSILCTEGCYLTEVFGAFYETFGDGLVQFWKHPKAAIQDLTKLETPWHVRVQLMKTRRTFPSSNKQRPVHLEQAFPDSNVKNEFDNLKIEVAELPLEKPKINFTFHSFVPTVGRSRFLNMKPPHTSGPPQPYVVLGKRTLLSPKLNSIKISRHFNHCYVQTMASYTL